MPQSRLLPLVGGLQPRAMLADHLPQACKAAGHPPLTAKHCNKKKKEKELVAQGQVEERHPENPWKPFSGREATSAKSY